MALPRRLIKIALAPIAFFLLVFLIFRFMPYPDLDDYMNRSYGYALLDRNGQALRVIPSKDGIKSEWMPIDLIPDNVLNIFIKAEDKRFYFHTGFDLIAIAAAGIRNFRSGRTVSGASTITMQLARLIKSRPKTAAGKLMEIFDALRLEARLSKRQILELWINGIPFGSNIEGVPAAGRARFGRSLTELDDARIALLAVIPRRPGFYDPANNAQAAVNAALPLARRCNLNLDESALYKAAAEAAQDNLSDEKAPFFAPHFTSRAAALIQAKKTKGPVRTTLDLEMQLYAEKRLLSELAMLENNRASNGAVLAIDNATGEVFVYAGSASWFDDEASGKIDGIRVRNQPGSCLKPFLYALALEDGFLPNDILPDIPSVFGSSEAYSPGNFNRRFNGPVRFRIALASSLNVPAVYLAEKTGVSNFEDFLAKLGFDSIASSRGNYGVGLALGNAEVSLEELTRAFTVFPRGGSTLNLQFLLDQNTDVSHNIISPYSANIITDILSDRASRYIGFGPAASFETGFPSMFKTGTANQFQHIWALGASARFTVGVWMGNFSGETVIGRTGSSIPARIASDLLKALQSQDHAFSGQSVNFPIVTDNVSEIEVCALSGMAAGGFCPGTAKELLPSEKLPALCNWHRRPAAEPVFPPEYQAWLAERFRLGRVSEESTGGAYIRLPVSGSVFYYNPALPPEAQAIRVETAGFNQGALVFANEVLQGSINYAGVFTFQLRRGIHRIMVEDENYSDTVEIEVR